MPLFNLRMHASRTDRGQEVHISGAERIAWDSSLPDLAHDLCQRALVHSRGLPDAVYITAKALNPEKVLHYPALAVHSYEEKDVASGLARALTLLASQGIDDSRRILALLEEAREKRGALLVDARSLERLERDPRRGVRASCMDLEGGICKIAQKVHFVEALILASKVAHAPGICAELCLSDDPDYVTGYVASKSLGYCRITPLKPLGSPFGGRIFFYEGDKSDLDDCVHFLEEQPVLIDMGAYTSQQAKSIEKSLLPSQAPDSLHADTRNHEPHSSLQRPDKWAYLEQKLESLREQHLLRSIDPLSSGPGPYVKKQGKRYLLLSSNDYLGLANEERVKAQAAKALKTYGTGSGGSRLTSGSLCLHTALEEALARFKGKESCLLFATGYQANVGTIQALCGKGDVIFSDALNHASIIDGCRLSGAEIVVYAHNDMADLEAKIREHPGAHGLVVSDAVFSMDGDLLNFPKFLEIARRYDLLSMVDEAHATGVLGAHGRGIEEYYGLSDSADVSVGTLSKALGSEGGFVVGSQRLITYLRNCARSFIFSTALSPAPVAAAHAALNILEAEPWRVERLRDNTRLFCSLLAPLGQVLSPSAIVPVLLYDEAKALRCAAELAERGIFVQAIRYPSVARGRARLRFALRSDHESDDLIRACSWILELCQK